ncbi:methyltransferase domain-containing protein [Actinomadura barringtoniae]|uniref:Methyltransferase domain-containing protein n=1 Tax=Actinomadura barringtoniae TaxID=1427535 RepID=A0A939P986_9ACTN|nr:class I SAM-dependent methyltransferase [Actinomadura barringtoniae]MBO2448235.1 methyltransferase domain-containing protein [Actinomadura barringtoniae]
MTGRVGYYLSYRLGLAFWDTFDTDRALADLIEGPNALRPGRALDLGCGTGRNSVYLAQHGWDVTGIDLVETTIAQARQRATTAGVQAHFIQGDITHLEGLGDFTLLIDFGCFHSVPLPKRDAYAAAVTRAAAPGATLWMWGLGIKPRFGLGVTEAELRTRFKAWCLETTDQVPGQELRAITRNMPLVQRPARALMTRRWFPHAYRFRLTRRP